MELLLDTHSFVWWILEDPQLSQAARAAIEADGAVVHVNIASAWEIAIKVGLGRWPTATELLHNFETAVVDEAFLLLPISVAHTRQAGLMTAAHRDPFDRLLATQAQIEGLVLVSSDRRMPSLGAKCLW